MVVEQVMKPASVALCLPMLLCMACASTGVPVSELRQMGQRGDSQALLQAWPETRRDTERVAIINGLAKTPEDSAGRDLILVAAVRHRSKNVRLAALRALQAYEGPEISRTLIAALGHEWPQAREISRSILELRDGSADEALLVAARGDQNALVRAGAVRVLTSNAMRRQALKVEVAQICTGHARADTSAHVREAAAEGLGRLQVESSRATLAELANTDESAQVRMAADRALEYLGPKPIEAKVVVAVLPLENKTNKRKLDHLGETVADYVQAQLTSSDVCEVVDRAKVKKVIEELRKTGRAVYDGDAVNAPEIGAFKLANQLVYGSVQQTGRKYTIVLNRLDVSTLQLVPGSSATVSGYEADLDSLMAEATQRFIARFR